MPQAREKTLGTITRILILIILDITKTSSNNCLLCTLKMCQLMDLEEKFYENLQKHQSVDSGNRIIIFLDAH